MCLHIRIYYGFLFTIGTLTLVPYLRTYLKTSLYLSHLWLQCKPHKNSMCESHTIEALYLLRDDCHAKIWSKKSSNHHHHHQFFCGRVMSFMCHFTKQFICQHWRPYHGSRCGSWWEQLQTLVWCSVGEILDMVGSKS